MSAPVIQDAPRIRVPIVGIREIMVPVTPTMVNRRKFSHKKSLMVKDFFTFLLQEGHTLSGKDNSLPQSGQIFMMLVCTSFKDNK